MKKVVFNEVEFNKWILNYFRKNGKAPDINEISLKNGSPFNKDTVIKYYGSIEKMCINNNIPSRKNQAFFEKEKILKELRTSVFKNRTTNRDIVCKDTGRDRSQYVRLFGSYKKAIEESGIKEEHIVLMKHFDNYFGEEPIQFLKKELGKDNQWTIKQESLIERMLEVRGDAKEFRAKTNFNTIKKNFKFVSLIQIASGFCPDNIHLKKEYIANDGHKVDSLLEKKLDDWLSKEGFQHDVHVKYPNSKMISDFVVGKTFIELIGLKNASLSKYNEKTSKKIKLAKENNLDLILIEDLSLKSLDKLKAALLKRRETSIELLETP